VGLRRIVGLLALWTTVAVALAAVTGRHEADYYRLIKGGTSTQGIAVAARPHDQTEYTFEVNNRMYSGIGRTSVRGRSQASRIGDKVTVYYLPATPNINCLGDPQTLFSTEMGPVLLAVLLFPTALVLVLAFRRSGTRYIAK
jgi:hypothetical protein